MDELKVLDKLSIMEIMELVPHRYPFLLVDKIIDIKGEESFTGVKNVTFNEPHFLGHFPKVPIMPGVLILEGMAQTACAICMKLSFGNASEGYSFYLMTIDKGKFRHPVVPGDTLLYCLKRVRRRKNTWLYEGRAFVEDKLVAEARISAVIVPEV